MKKLLALGLAAVMAMGLTACSSSNAASTGSTASASSSASSSAASSEAEEVDTSNMGPSLKKIYERGYITIGTDTTFPPFSFQDPATGDCYGFVIEVAQNVADKLGVELKIEAESFATLLADLQSDKIDLVCAAVTVTEERKEIMAFSDPYIATADTMVVRTEDLDQYSDLASFEGKTIAANNGTSQQTHAESVEGSVVVACDGTADAILQLTAGTVDAAVCDNVNGKRYVEASNGALTMVETAAFEFNDKAIAAQLGNDDLVAVVNEVIAEMEGSRDELIDYYTTYSIELLGTN